MGFTLILRVNPICCLNPDILVMKNIFHVETITLWRPTGKEELDLVETSNWKQWPARLAEQPIFYPVLNRDYAMKIARDWNAQFSGHGFVTRFHVRKAFLEDYEIHQVGGETILEYWIPAEDISEFNKNIVGKIEVTDTFSCKETTHIEHTPLIPITDIE
jgi:hypothetical protein